PFASRGGAGPGASGAAGPPGRRCPGARGAGGHAPDATRGRGGPHKSITDGPRRGGEAGSRGSTREAVPGCLGVEPGPSRPRPGPVGVLTGTGPGRGRSGSPPDLLGPLHVLAGRFPALVGFCPVYLGPLVTPRGRLLTTAIPALGGEHHDH